MEMCSWASEVKPNQLSKWILKDVPTLKLSGLVKMLPSVTKRIQLF